MDKLIIALSKYQIEFISTGGTRKYIEERNMKVQDISHYTGFPEILDGRVKTLNPKIYGGILFKRESREHIKTIEAHAIKPLDLVIVNLYPFEEVTKKRGVTKDIAIENIDIGGVTLLRAASKNYDNVVVLSSVSDYEEFIKHLNENDGSITSDFSLKLAQKAFKTTSYYDHLISSYYETLTGIGDKTTNNILPQTHNIKLKIVEELRYGENPHQKAALYRSDEHNIEYPEKLHGKQLSYNNMIDIDAAFRLVAEFKEHMCIAIIKHTNPCGVALSKKSLSEAYVKARECDLISFFGGIVASTREIDQDTADLISESFLEAIIAPSFSEKAFNILSAKKNIRLIKFDFKNIYEKDFYKETIFGYVAQSSDLSGVKETYENKTNADDSKIDMDTLEFAMKVCKHVKSNAIVLAKDLATVGIGAGQMSRIDSLKIALEKAGDKRSYGSIMASDAFFPFTDCVKLAGEKKIAAIVQPGGSKNDEDSIKEATILKIPMFFTGLRHFKH